MRRLQRLPETVGVCFADGFVLFAGVVAPHLGLSSPPAAAANCGCGGVCTAWKRKGYTVDGCIHWLMGAKPGPSFHQMYREVGALEGNRLIPVDHYGRFTDEASERIHNPFLRWSVTNMFLPEMPAVFLFVLLAQLADGQLAVVEGGSLNFTKIAEKPRLRMPMPSAR
nr:hypothetical protein [Anaerolineae bacterium]